MGVTLRRGWSRDWGITIETESPNHSSESQCTAVGQGCPEPEDKMVTFLGIPILLQDLSSKMCIYFNTYILIHIYFDVALTQMDVNFNGKLQRNFPLRMSFLEPCFRPLVTGNHFSFGTFSNKTLPKMSQPLYPTLLKTPYLKRGLALWSATHNN